MNNFYKTASENYSVGGDTKYSYLVHYFAGQTLLTTVTCETGNSWEYSSKT